jgi:hypothetical protein
MKSEKISVDYDTSSIKSMKSDISKMTNFYNTNYPHILQENIREEEEDSQEVSSDNGCLIILILREQSCYQPIKRLKRNLYHQR